MKKILLRVAIGCGIVGFLILLGGAIGILQAKHFQLAGAAFASAGLIGTLLQMPRPQFKRF